tara:strand:+ start:49 stop:510 length:462 start_codon:yes stop_codon:yes gene_type:complete
MKNKYSSFLIIISVTFIASAIGGYITNTFKEPWYSELNLAFFNPPSWVFAPVWTILYIFMSIAVWNIWNEFKNKKILIIYFIHLFFNASWSIVFFGFHQIFLALLNLIIIIIFIIYLMWLYKKLNKLSFYLMLPYLLWSSYALVLNFSIMILN